MQDKNPPNEPKGSTDPANASPNLRFYGAGQSPYTPIGTRCVPRTGRMNEVLSVAPGIVAVVLQDGSQARLDESDYQLIIANGWLNRWTRRKSTGDYFDVMMNYRGMARTVARVILDARKGEKVGYRDGDTNNLTRANLILKAKGGKEIGFSNRSCQPAQDGEAEAGKTLLECNAPAVRGFAGALGLVAFGPFQSAEGFARAPWAFGDARPSACGPCAGCGGTCA